MKRWIFPMALAIGLATQAQAATHKLCSGFLPENDMWIGEDQALAGTGITRAQFDNILDRLQSQYATEFSRRGVRLVIERKWSDGTVNAYASRSGSSWKITMFGGFARHASITYDGFASVACHEIGHHVGGAPRYSGDWASNEGQSDYYATAKCLKRMFEKEDNEKILAGRTIDPTAKSHCESTHRSRQDQLLCIRTAMAGVSLAGVFQSFEGGRKPALNTPDKKVVSRTNSNHPASQCRLDTYFQGGLCQVSPHSAVSDRDASVGYCYDSRTYAKGRRPLCWFKP